MTYSDKREFAARVFAAVLEYASPGGDWWEGNPQWGLLQSVPLLALAQLDALPDADTAAEQDRFPGLSGNMSIQRQIDAAYALALQLAPLVGVEVPDGKS